MKAAQRQDEIDAQLLAQYLWMAYLETSAVGC